VYDRPKLMSRRVLDQFFVRLQEHVTCYGLSRYWILLHGGEPTLWGKANARYFFERAAAVEGCSVETSMTTNGTLIDKEWALLLKEYGCSVTVSIDGPPASNDSRRLDFRGR